MDILGQRLRRTRRAQDLTQKELARRANVHMLTISRIEHGTAKHVYAETVRELARGLGVSMDYLCGLADEEKIYG